MASDQILVEERSSARILTLNRPNRLNALSLEMFSRLLELLFAYAEDSLVKLVILKGKGRAFSSGGDMSAVTQCVNRADWRAGADYFRKGYTLDYVTATYDKPQVSILNGLAMGGGATLAMHGRFCIATEKSIFAMPETALGHFPDAGASYCLQRFPGFFGEYVGLTGARLDGAEMLACGLATHFVQSQKLSSLEEALCEANSGDPDVISSTITRFSNVPCLKKASAYRRLDIVNKCFSRRTVEEIILSLEMEHASNKDEWISSAIHSLKKASPTSLKISLRMFREARLQDVGNCLIREFRMVCHVLRGDISKDFVEGCRAIFLDKDKKPKWEPSKLEQVSEEMVDVYFSKMDEDDWEELKLSFPSTLTQVAMPKL